MRVYKVDIQTGKRLKSVLFRVKISTFLKKQIHDLINPRALAGDHSSQNRKGFNPIAHILG
jgi:hypothetical protein